MIRCSFSSAYQVVGEDLFSISAMSRYAVKLPALMYFVSIAVNHLHRHIAGV